MNKIVPFIRTKNPMETTDSIYSKAALAVELDITNSEQQLNIIRHWKLVPSHGCFCNGAETVCLLKMEVQNGHEY